MAQSLVTTLGMSSGLFLVLVSCLCGTFTYTIHRLDDERGGQGTDLEIDFYSNYDAKKFYDTLSRLNQRPDPSFQSPSPPPEQKPDEGTSNGLDSWSVIWYVASFGGLIAFFLVVSCSEWCCRRAARTGCGVDARDAPHRTAAPAAATQRHLPDAPPPSYEEFAPPSYESICLGRGEKSEYDIYVVPVHALGPMIEAGRAERDDPPSYLSASGDFTPAFPPGTA